MTRTQAYVALNLLPHIGPVRVQRLRERCGSVEAILTASENEWRSVEGIGTEVIKSLRTARDGEAAGREMAEAARLGMQILDQEDERYPEALREIYDPPLVLYVQGTIPDKWRRGVAMVGSRQTTHYGLEMARRFGYQLAYAGLPVISGLARGIDTAAHQGALAAQGTTWAVLGCSLDHLYPPENRELADKIAATNCLLSEFPLGTKPDRQTFPMRNRIVSGLGFGVLVVEAGEGSGALITARQALDQGRQVFAIPGRIDNPHAAGTNRLIKDGAKLVSDVSDILGEMEYLFPPGEARLTRATPEGLSGEEKLIFEAMTEEEMAMDAIIAKTQLPSATVSPTLLRLEMKKLVRQLPGRNFVRVA